MSGSDAYENWILLDALDADRTPAETCWRFHALIGDDLRSLGVELDEWISPLDDDHAGPYQRVHEELLKRLADSRHRQEGAGPHAPLTRHRPPCHRCVAEGHLPPVPYARRRQRL